MISIFSQNLCSWGSGENTISKRTHRFRRLIDMYTPDIIGVQEATPEWREYLYANMLEYDHIGLPRQEGAKGESCDIFWKKDMYTLLSGGTRWLSDTPHVISKLDESSHYRVFTWAVLKQNESQKQFLVCNIHTDFITQEVCLQQLKMMTDFAENLTMPCVFLGDMNMERDHSGYAYMCSKYNDTWQTASVREFTEVKTSHDFGIKEKDCDYVFVNSGLTADKHRVACEKIDGEFVADHYGIYAQLTWACDKSMEGKSV